MADLGLISTHPPVCLQKFLILYTFQLTSTWAERPENYVSMQVNAGVCLSCKFQFSSVAQSCPTLCDPMNHSMPGSLSITNSRSLPKLTFIELGIPSSHLILCRPLLLLPPIRPSTRVFSNESNLHMRWPKYCSFSFNISPSNEHPGLISFWMISHFSPRDSQESSTPQFESINSLALSFLYSPTLISIHHYWKNHSLD